MAAISERSRLPATKVFIDHDDNSQSPVSVLDSIATFDDGEKNLRKSGKRRHKHHKRKKPTRRQHTATAQKQQQIVDSSTKEEEKTKEKNPPRKRKSRTVVTLDQPPANSSSLEDESNEVEAERNDSMIGYETSHLNPRPPPSSSFSSASSSLSFETPRSLLSGSFSVSTDTEQEEGEETEQQQQETDDINKKNNNIASSNHNPKNKNHDGGGDERVVVETVREADSTELTIDVEESKTVDTTNNGVEAEEIRHEHMTTIPTSTRSIGSGSYESSHDTVKQDNDSDCASGSIDATMSSPRFSKSLGSGSFRISFMEPLATKNDDNNNNNNNETEADSPGDPDETIDDSVTPSESVDEGEECEIGSSSKSAPMSTTSLGTGSFSFSAEDTSDVLPSPIRHDSNITATSSDRLVTSISMSISARSGGFERSMDEEKVEIQSDDDNPAMADNNHADGSFIPHVAESDSSPIGRRVKIVVGKLDVGKHGRIVAVRGTKQYMVDIEGLGEKIKMKTSVEFLASPTAPAPIIARAPPAPLERQTQPPPPPPAFGTNTLPNYETSNQNSNPNAETPSTQEKRTSDIGRTVKIVRGTHVGKVGEITRLCGTTQCMVTIDGIGAVRKWKKSLEFVSEDNGEDGRDQPGAASEPTLVEAELSRNAPDNGTVHPTSHGPLPADCPQPPPSPELVHPSQVESLP